VTAPYSFLKRGS